MVLQLIRQTPVVTRPDHVALPTRSRPQLYNTGERPRVTHLPRYARVSDNAERVVLPDSTGQDHDKIFGVAQGLSYRNAALHVLLNTPIFFNFVRAHYHNVRQNYNSNCRIQNCLMCHMAHVAAHYFGADRGGDQSNYEKDRALADAVFQLWTACLEIFWGPHSKSSQKVGPSSDNDEFYTESFLLHFLLAIQRQLEANPAEYQTFLAMFTTHIVRSRRCSNTGCRWASSAFRWEESLFLPISVQKPARKNAHTDILAGLKLAIEREPMNMSTKKGSINATLKCPLCNLPTILTANIVNFPEVLILVRNLDQLAPGEEPDIPFKENLEMTLFGSADVRYGLVSGASELKINPVISRSVAFARGVRKANWNEWSFMNHNGIYETLPRISDLDQTQRRHVTPGQDFQDGFMFPELFVYMRQDGKGVSERDVEGIETWTTWGDTSPMNKYGRECELVSRSITDLFAQKIGNGLLKFKIQLTPADPGPHESIPFTLDLGYEHGNCSWVADSKIYGRLVPSAEREREPINTPDHLRPLYRYLERKDGVSTPREPTDRQLQLPHAGDGVPPYPKQTEFPQVGPPSPFVVQNSGDSNNPNAMDLDPNTGPRSFTDNPVVQRWREAAEAAAAAKYLNQAKTGNREEHWRPRTDNKNDRKRPKKGNQQQKGDTNNNGNRNDKNNGGKNNNRSKYNNNQNNNQTNNNRINKSQNNKNWHNKGKQQ